MDDSPDPVSDPARLAALRALSLLDAPPNAPLQRITALAARVLGSPVAMVNLVDEHRQFFAAEYGIGEPWSSARESPLTHSICRTVVRSNRPLRIVDIRTDPAFPGSKVTEVLGVVAYLGVPLHSDQGDVLGAFCAIDREPRAWTDRHMQDLADLAEWARAELLAEPRRRRREGRRDPTLNAVRDAVIETDTRGRIVGWNPAAAELFGRGPEEALGRDIAITRAPGPGPTPAEARADAIARGRWSGEVRHARPGGGSGVSEVVVVPVLDPEGRVLGAVEVHRDATARKEVERALARSRKLFRRIAEAMPGLLYLFDLDTSKYQFVNAGATTILGLAVGPDPIPSDALVHPEDVGALAASRLGLDGPGTGGALEHEYRARRADGEYRWLRGREVLFARGTGGRARQLLGLAMDVTERRRDEAALRGRNRELEALSAASAAMGRSLRPRRVLAALAEVLADHLGITGGRLVGPGRLGLGWGPPSPTLSTLAAEVSAATGAGASRAPAPMARPDAPAPWRHALGIPLSAEGPGGRFLCLFAPEPLAEDPARSAFFGVLGRQLGAALQNARLFENARDSRRRLRALSLRLVGVQEAERRHVVRELHDEVGQVLTGLRISLELADRQPPADRSSTLHEARSLVDRLIAQVRDLSLRLRPTMLDDLGLLPALLWHIGHYSGRTGVKVAFEHAGVERRFAPEVETAVYRIAQEALTNVARHAGVDSAVVRLWAGEEGLGLQVQDSGKGFDPRSTADGTSSGLAGMRERVMLLGGRLRVESTPGGGTRLTAELPTALTPERPVG